MNSATILRSYIDIILKQVVDDINNQISRTNEQFRARIAQMSHMKERLQEIHNETSLQVNEMVRNITRLEKELAEKEGYIALCQMRLCNRAQRPGPELCKDQVQDVLICELATLRDTCIQMQKMIVDSNATLRYLLNSQMAQEEEINLKTNSLKIDHVDCVTLRNGMDFPAF